MSEPTRSVLLALATMLALYSGVYASASLLAPKLFLKYLAIRDWSYGLRGQSSLPDSILNYPLSPVQKAKAYALFLGGAILGFHAAGAIMPIEFAQSLTLPSEFGQVGRVAIAMLFTVGFVEQEERVSRSVGEFNPDHLAWHRDYEKADADIRSLRDWDYDLPRQLSIKEQSVPVARGAARRWAKLGREDARKGISRCAITTREALHSLGESWSATNCGDAYSGGWYSATRELEKSGWRNGALEARIGISPEAHGHENSQDAEALAEARRTAARDRVQLEEKTREEATRVAAEISEREEQEYWRQVKEWDALAETYTAKQQDIILNDDDLLGPKNRVLSIASNDALNRLNNILEITYEALDLDELEIGDVIDLSGWVTDITGLKAEHLPIVSRAVRRDSGVYISIDALQRFSFDFTKEGIILLVFCAQWLNYVGADWSGVLDRREPVLLSISRLSRNKHFLKNHKANDETAGRLVQLVSGLTVRLGRLGCFVKYAVIGSDEAVREVTLHLSHRGRARIVGQVELVGPSRRTFYS